MNAEGVDIDTWLDERETEIWRHTADLERRKRERDAANVFLDGLAYAEAIAPEAVKVLIEFLFEEELYGMPPVLHLFDKLREDARWWAETVTQQELEAYIAAGLREVERREMAERPRKRLLLALWQTMPGEWQRDFLARVDPSGRWIGGGA